MNSSRFPQLKLSIGKLKPDEVGGDSLAPKPPALNAPQLRPRQGSANPRAPGSTTILATNAKEGLGNSVSKATVSEIATKAQSFRKNSGHMSPVGSPSMSPRNDHTPPPEENEAKYHRILRRFIRVLKKVEDRPIGASPSSSSKWGSFTARSVLESSRRDGGGEDSATPLLKSARPIPPSDDQVKLAHPPLSPRLNSHHASPLLVSTSGLSKDEILELIDGVKREPYRTFDRKACKVVYHPPSKRPDQAAITKRIYNRLWTDAYEVENAEKRVNQLPATEQLRLAAMSIQRKAQGNLHRALRRGVQDEESARTRAHNTMITEYQELVTHLGFDTEELSLIRLHNAATDTVLYQKAEYLASLEVDMFQANLISQNVTPTDVLCMQLDAFRHQNVPFPLRRRETGGTLVTATKGGGVASRAGVHHIVERQLNSLQ